MKEDIYAKHSLSTENLGPMALRTDGGRHMKPELSGSATNLWKRQHRKMKILQPWRTKESLTARWQQQHLHKQRQMKRSVPTSRWARENCRDTKFADENWSKSLRSLQQQCAEPPVRCGRKYRMAFSLEASVACWPKSCFRTEVPKFPEH